MVTQAQDLQFPLGIQRLQDLVCAKGVPAWALPGLEDPRPMSR